jgi:iron complex transport system substrate-binding protein
VRPLPLLGIALTLALVGCGAPPRGGDAAAAAPTAAAARTRIVTDVTGTKVEIPVQPQRVVATDEPAALNLLAIGITPVAVFQGWKTVVPAELLKSRGIKVLTTADYHPKLEEVAVQKPDLIVISTNPLSAGALPDYASVAPTLRALFSAPRTELARTWGEYFGTPERVQAIENRMATFAAEIASKQPNQPLSLSALQSYGTSLYYADGGNSLHAAIAAAGFTRPTLQDVASDEGAKHGGWAAFSPETLPDHDADIIAIMASTQYSPEAITRLPLFRSLTAAQANRVVKVDGDFWAGGSLFYAYWVLCDLREFVNGRLRAGGAGDATPRWNAFVAMIEKE